MSDLRISLPDEFVESIATRVAELMGSEPSEPYMDVSEAAEYLRCKRKRIYELRRGGTPRLGPRRHSSVFRREDLDAALQREGTQFKYAHSKCR